MTEDYRTRELERCRDIAKKTRQLWEKCTHRGDKRKLAEDLEFWTNRTSFLSHVRGDN